MHINNVKYITFLKFRDTACIALFSGDYCTITHNVNAFIK